MGLESFIGGSVTPSFSGGDAGPAVSESGPATSGVFGNFSVGGQSATETVTSAFKTTGTQFLLVGGAIFLATLFLKLKK